MSCGIYKIRNKLNNKCYIGCSYNIEKRFYEHKRTLNKGKHHSLIFQRAWDKYGEDNFELEIILECNRENLKNEEQKFLNTKPEYNRERTSNGGLIHTEKTKQKIREARARQVIIHTDETKQKIGNKNRGKIFSEEHKRKLSEKKKGIKLTDEHKKNISKSVDSNKQRERQKLSVIKRKQNKLIV